MQAAEATVARGSKRASRGKPVAEKPAKRSKPLPPAVGVPVVQVLGDVPDDPLPVDAASDDGSDGTAAAPLPSRYSDLPGEVWGPALSTGVGPDQLLVSSEGRVRIKGGRVALGPPQYGSKGKTGYCSVMVCGKRAVHDLVCRAFHGKRPTPQHTPDHKNRDKSDNRACNLRWATKPEQAKNQRKKRPQSTGQPVLARPVGPTGEWTAYPSGIAAAKALGVNSGNVRHVANGKAKMTGGYVFKWAPAREPQTDLPAEGTKPAEVWKDASPVLRISNRGRVQTKHSLGTGWSHRYTPVPTLGHVYAQVVHRGKTRGVHLLVWELFGTRALKPKETVDHIDRDATNNGIENMRPATKREQNFNQTRQHTSQIMHALKDPVRGRPADGSREWEVFESQNEAARALSARFPGKAFYQSSISAVVRGTQKQHQGWVFELAA
ncbi:MAG: HNH endonuclease [Actinomycetales bacterium]